MGPLGSATYRHVRVTCARPNVSSSKWAYHPIRQGKARDCTEPCVSLHEWYWGTSVAASQKSDVFHPTSSQVDFVLSPIFAYYVDVLHSRSAEVLAASS